MSSFFISYTGADRAWAEWIAWGLKSADHEARLHAWDYRLGTNLVKKSAATCDRIIVVLSAAYLRSAYAAPEWAATFTDDPKTAVAKIVSVRVAECEPADLLKSTAYVDLVGLDEVAAEEALVSGAHTGGSIDAPIFLGLRRLIGTLPIYPPDVHLWYQRRIAAIALLLALVACILIITAVTSEFFDPWVVHILESIFGSQS